MEERGVTTETSLRSNYRESRSLNIKIGLRKMYLDIKRGTLTNYD